LAALPRSGATRMPIDGSPANSLRAEFTPLPGSISWCSACRTLRNLKRRSTAEIFRLIGPRNLYSGRVGLLCERNEFSASVAWTRRSQDGVETSRGKVLVRLRGRDRSVYLRNVRHAEHWWWSSSCRSTATLRSRETARWARRWNSEGKVLVRLW